ncbi:unnamed protein product [Didymodactylos carnosus]|uniref:DUF4127 family protein n=1 Tax=Didymodactylos carnosus TaxID=1234261 RepID=A0A8S2IX94_9BILA|nr:unnamed protein product [Didymodactylos carnosus]CAF3784160.1 unnamed protein product [Didymodactylos carnosus]
MYLLQIYVLFSNIYLFHCLKSLLFIPLDERFTTRNIVLNLGNLIKDDYELITPSLDIISHWKSPANIDALQTWLNEEIIKSNCTNENNNICYSLISSELLFYGGLIHSRCSNDSVSIIQSRIEQLINLKRKYSSSLKLYLSQIIMRIPAYDEDFEEPHYWAIYGRLIFEWSFYYDRYTVLHQQSDYDEMKEREKKIPENVLNEFLWRRQRNYNVTNLILTEYSQYFEKIWITLDDNALYGLNKAEERNLTDLINNILNITDKVNLYPGADEVSLTMLSKIVVDDLSLTNKLRFSIIYRNTSTVNFIPNYEGSPLNESIVKQVNAAGGIVVSNNDPNFNLNNTDVIVIVNNWSTNAQQEATQTQTCENYTTLEQFLNYSSEKAIVLADVRYSNGGDLCFVDWILNNKTTQGLLKFGNYSYAGWNTNGNTLGTCISNGMLLSLFQTNVNTINQNKRFTLYRFAEDAKYQASLRQSLYEYLTQVSYDPTDHLDVDIDFYSQFVQKGLRHYVQQIQKEWNLESLYFPWNRTFEIGFSINSALQISLDTYQH